jgi:integrase
MGVSRCGEKHSKHTASQTQHPDTDGEGHIGPSHRMAYSELRRDYFNREIWKPAIAAAQLPEDTTFHDLRHTFASTALAEGVPISEVSRWLGHKSITTTVDLYGHLVPEASGRARDALDKAFAGTRVCGPNVPPDATESR